MSEQGSQKQPEAGNSYTLKHLTDFERSKLEREQRRLQSECITRIDKLSKLSKALAIESNAAIQFQLEKQIESEKEKINLLTDQLSQIEECLMFSLVASNTEASSSQDSYSHGTKSYTNISLNGPLELIAIKPQFIQEINQRLEGINQLQETQSLAQTERLIVLQEKLQSLNHKDIQQILTEISDTADQLIKETIRSISQQLKDLDESQNQSFLRAKSSKCLNKGLEILEEFQRDLAEGKQVAQWLDDRRPHLVKLLGNYALKTHQDIKPLPLDQRKVDKFYFTIEQFLECLSHCLVWGDASILELPEIPRVFESKVYETAFIYLRDTVPKPRISNAGSTQLDEYIGILLLYLPLCPEISF